MTLIQVVMFVLIVGILVILFLMATQPKIHAADFNADLAGFQKERGEIIERINQYQQAIENNKYRLAQLDALIDYAQRQVAAQQEPKKDTKEMKPEDFPGMPLSTLSGTANEKKKK
jgi:hypothetical protein